MGISNLTANSTSYFSWTSTNGNSSSVNNHRMVAPYAGQIIVATFVCDDGISADPTGIPAPAIFSIGKTTKMTTATSSWTTHTDTAGAWADTIMGSPAPDFGRAAPVTSWAAFSWDAGDVIEAKLVPGNGSGASSDRGTLSMVIQWEA